MLNAFDPLLASFLAAKLQANPSLCCFSEMAKGRVLNLVTRYARQGDAAGLEGREFRKYVTRNVRREYRESGVVGFIGWVSVLSLILQAIRIIQEWRKDRRDVENSILH